MYFLQIWSVNMLAAAALDGVIPYNLININTAFKS